MGIMGIKWNTKIEKARKEDIMKKYYSYKDMAEQDRQAGEWELAEYWLRQANACLETLLGL